MLANLAERARRLDLSPPQLRERPGIRIRDGRHPVVEQVQDEPFTPNDMDLDEETRMLIITGPNMGGKSTYLRQVALITLLAQAGGFVPADSARIGIADRIFTRVGASDNLARGESTFYMEMSETAHILHQMSRRSLVILDELCSGTNPGEGIAIFNMVVGILWIRRIVKLKY